MDPQRVEDHGPGCITYTDFPEDHSLTTHAISAIINTLFIIILNQRITIQRTVRNPDHCGCMYRHMCIDAVLGQEKLVLYSGENDERNKITAIYGTWTHS